MDYIYSEIDPQIAIDANQLLPQADETDIGKVVTVTGKNQYGLEESAGSDTPDWNTLEGKPFETLGSGLSVDSEGVLSATGGSDSFASWYIKSWNNPDDDSYVHDFYIKYDGITTSMSGLAQYMGQNFSRIYFVDDDILNKISIDSIPMLALNSNLTTGSFLYPDLRVTELFYNQGFHDVSILGLAEGEMVKGNDNLSADTPIHIFLAYKSDNDIYVVLPKSLYDNLVYVQPSGGEGTIE